MEPLSDLIVGDVSPYPYRLSNTVDLYINFNYSRNIRGTFCYELQINRDTELPYIETVDKVTKRRYMNSFLYIGNHERKLDNMFDANISSGTLEDLNYSVLYEAVYEKYIADTPVATINSIFIQDRLLHLKDSESYYKDEIKRISDSRNNLFRKLEEMSK